MLQEEEKPKKNTPIIAAHKPQVYILVMFYRLILILLTLTFSLSANTCRDSYSYSLEHKSDDERFALKPDVKTGKFNLGQGKKVSFKRDKLVFAGGAINSYLILQSVSSAPLLLIGVPAIMAGTVFIAALGSRLIKRREVKRIISLIDQANDYLENSETIGRKLKNLYKTVKLKRNDLLLEDLALLISKANRSGELCAKVKNIHQLKKYLRNDLFLLSSIGERE